MRNGMNRRNFLGVAAAGGAAAWAWAARGAAEAPSRRVAVGVMGLSRGRALARVFAQAPGVEVRHVSDADTRRMAACAEDVAAITGKRPTESADFRAILDDPEVDALVCAAPNHWHAAATILACQAGKHVYVEKPCSHTPQEGEWMIAAARAHKRAVQVGTQRRSGPAIREAIEFLRGGELGRVYSARATYANRRGGIGRGKPADPPTELDYALWQGPAPHTPYLDNRVHYNWHWFWHWGNGELGNNGVHTLDLCRWGLGVDYPVRVVSSGGRHAFDDDQETPDTHTVAFEFEGRKTAVWEGRSCNPHRQEDFVVFHAEGGALALAGHGDYTVFDMRGKPVRTVQGSLGEPEHVADFVAAIRDDTPDRLHCGIAEANPSTLLCHLGNIAHRTGRALRCDPANGHILDDAEAMAHWSRAYNPDWAPKV